ncbi:MAG: GNAT family N-acetyltransferase [Candidatus Bathyarchaeota archaeon]|nr:GNAT family N-acetyltransferase [Candidatus Bathyarchaeota archaeon]
MIEVKVCNFSQNQITDLREMRKLCEKESGWEPPQEYLDEWVKTVLGISRHDPNLVKTALVNNKIVGYCISVKRLHNYEGVVMDITWKTAYIWDLYVIKEYRNMGVGTTLLENTMAYLKSIGVEKVGLLVNYWNENAKKLFEKIGFRLWGYFMIKGL